MTLCLINAQLHSQLEIQNQNTHRLPRDNQRYREQQTSRNQYAIPIGEELATFDPWQVFPREAPWSSG